MYRKIEEYQHMTTNEASELYPDSFILMRMDSMDVSNHLGTILYVGDDDDELFSVLMGLEDSSLCGIIEGLEHRRSLGGLVIGG